MHSAKIPQVTAMKMLPLLRWVGPDTTNLMEEKITGPEFPQLVFPIWPAAKRAVERPAGSLEPSGTALITARRALTAAHAALASLGLLLAYSIRTGGPDGS